MLLLFSVLLAALAAPAPQAPAPVMPQTVQPDLRRPQWTPRQEDRDWLEALALSDLAGLHQRQCNQALLRPPALDKDPSELYLQLARADREPHKACHDRMAAALGSLKPDEDSPEQSRIIARVAEACRGSAAFVAQLNRHSQHCSPFQVGLAQGGEMRRLANIIGGLGLRIRHLASNGEHREALESGLELAALSQNLGQGWAGLHQGVMAAEQWLVSGLPWMRFSLSQPGVDAQLLNDFIKGASELLSHEPSLGKMLLADQAQFLLTSILPTFFGPGWSPRLPGATARKDDGPKGPRPPPGSQFSHPAQVMFFFLGQRLKMPLVLAACSDRTTPTTCLGLLEELTALEREMASEESIWQRFRLGQPRFGTLGALCLTLGLEGNPPRGPALEALAVHYYTRRATLAMLRAQAAVLAHFQKSGEFPSEQLLAQPVWRSILSDPVFGGALGLRLEGDLVSVRSLSVPKHLAPDQMEAFAHEFRLGIGQVPSSGSRNRQETKP